MMETARMPVQNGRGREASLGRRAEASGDAGVEEQPWDELCDLSRRGPFRIQLLPAFRANPMGKLGVGMVTDILFNLLPISVVVANLFTGGTNRQQPSQSFNMGEGISQLRNESLALLFQSLLLGDIQRNADTSCDRPVGVAQWLDIGTKRPLLEGREDRKSTRLNSSHSQISYAVFCLKKKKKQTVDQTT